MPVQGVMLRTPAVTIWAFCRPHGNHQDWPKARYLPARVRQGTVANRVKTLRDRKDPLYTSMLLQVRPLINRHDCGKTYKVSDR